ncbi:MAG: 3-dehydroquinate synthase II [Candidatus Heimdallarchaeota archaeon]|nr:3-dehydroquinate synthase II [Candidatus Heimdallarchaeota archaeon]
MFKLYISATSIESVDISEEDIRNKIDAIFVDTINFAKSDLFPNLEKFKLKAEKILDKNDNQIGMKLDILTPEAMEQSLVENPTGNLLLVETADWKIIPLENLIARYDGSDIIIIGRANSPQDIPIMRGILEVGVGGILISPRSKEELQEFLEIKEFEENKITLLELEVTEIQAAGMGDRVCVDTFSMLKKGEGILVGSTSQLFVLVEAEVHKSGYVNPRPFRVNAGVVSLYTLNGEKTNYLSELESGADVSVVNRIGAVRKEKIARVKIERRPMILLRLKFGERDYTVILQDAETVRLVTTESSIPINELKVGAMILGYISESARHFGMKVDEFVEEK